MTDGDDTLVWYAAYGSNCDAERFATYLTGGTPTGARHGHDGARDARPPRADEAVHFPSRLRFRGHSPRWGGGVAFLEHAPAPEGHGAWGRRYLITAGQFADVLAQENRRPTRPVPTDLPAGTSHRAGPGRYDLVLGLGATDGIPVLTFTAPDPPEYDEPTPPSPAYLAAILRGVSAAHRLAPTEVAAHLLRSPGVAPHWTETSLVALITTRPAG